MNSASRSLPSSVDWTRWQPKLWAGFRAYDAKTFAADCIAGITVGLVALPMAMAFGIASGVTPQAGIYTAIIGGFLILWKFMTAQTRLP